MEKIIIWGLPRSGTSLTASIVRFLGKDFGKIDELPYPAHPSGILESEDIMRLDHAIQASYRGQLFTPPDIPPTDDWNEKIIETVGDREAFKMTRLVPHLYERAFPVKFVIVERGLEDWIRACKKYGPNLERSDLIRMATMYENVKNELKSPSMRVYFDNLQENIQWTGERIAKFIGTPMPSSDITNLIKTRW